MSMRRFGQIIRQAGHVGKQAVRLDSGASS
jgi:hypothetical protein